MKLQPLHDGRDLVERRGPWVVYRCHGCASLPFLVYRGDHLWRVHEDAKAASRYVDACIDQERRRGRVA